MWGPELAEAFERDGHVTLRGAFDPDSAAQMSGAIWSFVESRTPIRRQDPSTWPQGPASGLSFKKLKRHRAFRAVVESPHARAALDGIFGEDAWETASGAQILFSFPDTSPEEWRVPSHLWHMDAPFSPTASPPRWVKLFSVVEPLPPRCGATLALAGTARLQAEYATGAADVDTSGDKQSWHRFMRRADPWLARFLVADDTADRNSALSRPHDVDGKQIELRELGGEPGDVHICHINLFHSVAPNAGDRPRVMVTHVARPVAVR
jgi:hypothetical protein